MTKNSILIGLSFLISKIVGILRETLLASHFGVSTANPAFNLDAYFAAFKLPDFLFNIVSTGVISAAFVPLFIDYFSKHSPERARRFASDTLYLLSIIVLLLSVVFFIGARYFVQILVPGFTGELLDQTVQLTRLMLITPILFTISGVFNGVNNSLNHFKGIALAPIVYNLGIIVGVLLWGNSLGVTGAAIGVIIGALASVIVQLPEIIRGGFTLHVPQAIWNEHTKRLLSLAVPRIGGMSITQLSLFVDTFLASLLATGSLTIMTLATNLYFMPVGIVGVSIAVTHFGHLSSLALNPQKDDFKKAVTESLTTLLFLLVPTSVGMLIISRPLVELLFVRGAFTIENARVTAQTLQILSIGIISTSIVQIIARAFYALKDTKAPLIVGLQVFFVNFAVAAVAAFYFKLSTLGLALGTASSSIVYSALLLYRLRKKLNTDSLIPWNEFSKYCFASVGMGGVLFILVGLLQTQGLPLLLMTTIVIVAGAGTYALLLWLLRSSEFSKWIFGLKNWIKHRL